MLAERFGAGSPRLLVEARSQQAVGDPATRTAGQALTAELAAVPGVLYTQSPWDLPDPRLVSVDSRGALIRVGLAVDDRRAGRVVDDVVRLSQEQHGPFTVTVTGRAAVDRYAEQQAEHGLVGAELVAFPLIGAVLLWAFGSVLAAALPLAVGAVTLAAAAATLRALTAVTDVSVFALNLTTALAFGLAVDYSLIMVSRFREELAEQRPVPAAVAATLASAGRTVLFASLDIGRLLLLAVLFPIDFFRSLGWAAISVALLSGVTVLLIVPSLLAATGPHLKARPGRGSGWTTLAGAVVRGHCPSLSAASPCWPCSACHSSGSASDSSTTGGCPPRRRPASRRNRSSRTFPSPGTPLPSSSYRKPTTALVTAAASRPKRRLPGVLATAGPQGI